MRKKSKGKKAAREAGPTHVAEAREPSDLAPAAGPAVAGSPSAGAAPATIPADPTPALPGGNGRSDELAAPAGAAQLASAVAASDTPPAGDAPDLLDDVTLREREEIAEAMYKAAVSRAEIAEAMYKAAVSRAEIAEVREKAAATLTAALQARERAAAEREAIANARDRAALERDSLANDRDRAASQREAAAVARDAAAATRETAAADRDREIAARAAALAEAEAAANRRTVVPASVTAEMEAADAELERARLEAELQRAHLDALTGAFRREMGRLALRNEIDRARRSDSNFVVAFIDVDGLKGVNDREGHAAGDRILRTLVATMRANLRSYDPIVRFGGDEFIFGVASIDPTEVQHRIGVIDQSLRSATGVGITAGLASLNPGESLDELTARADEALIEAKRNRGQEEQPTF